MTHQAGPQPTPEDILTLNRAATVAQLLSGVLHQVNNSLQVIGGTAEMLEQRLGPAESSGKGLERIRTQSAKAGASIADVLAFARADPEARARVRLRELAARAVGLRTYAVTRAGLTIALEDGPADPVVHGSPVRLLQAVLNLVRNAEQALAGRHGGRIRVHVGEDGGSGTIEVEDEGPGFEAAIRPRAFEPFVTSRPRTEATGLGLAAVRLIAEGHGGGASVDDASLATRVRIQVPLA